MLNFCTLFDSNYLTRGLAMYESLKKHCLDFHLYIFAFDDKALNVLRELKLEKVTIISLSKFEDKKLLEIKQSRGKGEYCWTCTPSTILYVLKNYPVDNCTYLDADIYFFSNPKILIDEMGDKSVLITDHRYSKEYDQSEISGKYCVQFVTFKKNEYGLKVLNWWRDACIDWCYNRVEDGKFGDQKYLDDWITRFNSVYELQNLGGGVAPWNVNQYFFIKNGDQITCKEIASNQEFQLVFYHFHSLKFIDNNLVQLADKKYKLSDKTKELIYKPYLQSIKSLVGSINKKFGKNFINQKELKFDFIKKIKLIFFGKKRNFINQNSLF